MFDLSDFVTLSDAAKAAGVSRRTLQNHMREGTAPGHQRLGREVIFSREEVLAWKGRTYPDGARPGRRKAP